MNTSTEIVLRPALPEEATKIWEILQQSIERRKKDGSAQWQDGYPNLQSVNTDISKNEGFVITVNDKIAVYGALIVNDEPAYDDIEGKWLTDGDFVVIHRVAVDEEFHGTGLVQTFFEKSEEFARQNSIFSIKVDTNYDNGAMLHVLKKLNYTYCGEVYFRGSSRKAFEKVLA